jgi:hypothetical protein
VFIRPGCGALLDVDAVPQHYPIERRTFSEGRLGRKLPVDVGEYEERPMNVLHTWATPAT